MLASTIETYFNPDYSLWYDVEFAISTSLLIPDCKINLYGTGSSQRKIALLFSLDSLDSPKFYSKDSFTSYDGKKNSHYESVSYNRLLNDLIENVKSNHPTDYSEITGTIHIKDSLLGISIINTGFMQNEREVLHVAFILSRYMNVPVLTYTDGQIV